MTGQPQGPSLLGIAKCLAVGRTYILYELHFTSCLQFLCFRKISAWWWSNVIMIFYGGFLYIFISPGINILLFLAGKIHSWKTWTWKWLIHSLAPCPG